MLKYFFTHFFFIYFFFLFFFPTSRWKNGWKSESCKFCLWTWCWCCISTCGWCSWFWRWVLLLCCSYNHCCFLFMETLFFFFFFDHKTQFLKWDKKNKIQSSCAQLMCQTSEAKDNQTAYLNSQAFLVILLLGSKSHWSKTRIYVTKVNPPNFQLRMKIAHGSTCSSHKARYRNVRCTQRSRCYFQFQKLDQVFHSIKTTGSNWN